MLFSPDAPSGRTDHILHAIISLMSTSHATDTRFRLNDIQAKEIASMFGTPQYVISETHLRERIRLYIDSFKAAYPNSQVAFASKANSTLAVLAIAAQEGCIIDVASEGELRAALLAGIPAGRCHLHGNNKQPEELAFAFEAGVSEIVVDNFDEIELISELARTDEPASQIVSEALGVEVPAKKKIRCPNLVLRLAPGVDPHTHQKISTGQDDTKFGFNISNGAAEKALLRCLELELPVIGFHCHVGSQLLDPEAQRAGGETLGQFAKEMKAKHSFAAKVINVGGGLGVRYTDADIPMPIHEYCRLIVEAVLKGLEGSGLEPILVQEPGRSLVAESGVTLYTVGVVKTVPTGNGKTRTYVVVDGGLSDNPRPVMYGSKYTVERVAQPDETVPADTVAKSAMTVSGKHCETDKLFEDVPLPDDIGAGDLIQVLCTGAYNSSMASNYNRYRRPGTVLIRSDGSYVPVQRPETWDEMFAREILPPGLKV